MSNYCYHNTIAAPGPPILFLQAWSCISLGVHRNVEIGWCLRKGRRAGFPVSAGMQKGIRISWRKGSPTDSYFPGNGPILAAVGDRLPTPIRSRVSWCWDLSGVVCCRAGGNGGWWLAECCG